LLPAQKSGVVLGRSVCERSISMILSKQTKQTDRQWRVSPASEKSRINSRAVIDAISMYQPV